MHTSVCVTMCHCVCANRPPEASDLVRRRLGSVFLRRITFVDKIFIWALSIASGWAKTQTLLEQFWATLMASWCYKTFSQEVWVELTQLGETLQLLKTSSCNHGPVDQFVYTHHCQLGLLLTQPQIYPRRFLTHSESNSLFLDLLFNRMQPWTRTEYAQNARPRCMHYPKMTVLFIHSTLYKFRLHICDPPHLHNSKPSQKCHVCLLTAVQTKLPSRSLHRIM